MSNKPKFRTVVGKKTEYVFLMHEGKKIKVARHRVRALKRQLGVSKPSLNRRSLTKNQWSIHPAAAD